MILTVNEIKWHLRLDYDSDLEMDQQLERLEEAAVDYASQYLNREIPWTDDDSVPESVKQAILLLIAEFYENREQNVIGASVAELPTVQRLLHFYRTDLGI